MIDKKPKRPRDPNQLAKLIIGVTAGEIELPENIDNGKNAAAVARGRLGGLKGGKARAAALTPEERRRQAQKAIRSRWGQA